MSKKYFGLMKKDKKCPSCKGPFYNPRNHTTSICELCESKMCSVCGRISIHGVRASNEGFPFCPKHWSSFIRFKDKNGLNLNWSTDREFKIWYENRGKALTERLGLSLGRSLENLDTDLAQTVIGDETATEARERAIDKLVRAMESGIVIPGTDSEKE